MTGRGRVSSNIIKYIGFGFENVEIIAVSIDDIIELDFDGLSKESIENLDIPEDQSIVIQKAILKVRHEDIRPYTVDMEDSFFNYNDYPEVTYTNTHRVISRDDITNINFLDKDFKEVIPSFILKWHEEENPWVTPMQNELHHTELIDDGRNIYYNISIG